MIKKLGRFLIFFTSLACANPRISIITSVFKGNQFIKEFLKDITQQTIFDQCELIMIDANSPHAERITIFEYMKKYTNIFYIRLPHDPGVYGVWNLGIHFAHGEYITNANLDDRYHHSCYETFARALDENPDIDLVYSDFISSDKPNEPFQKISGKRHTMQEFSFESMDHCLPNDHPMWRKSLHDMVGYFDATFKSAGDYDFWLRAVLAGARFKRIPQVLGVHYLNPHGLSTETGSALISSELHRLRKKYALIWKLH